MFVFDLLPKPILPPGLKHAHCHRIRQIQAALPLAHGQAQALLSWEAIAQLVGQASCLGAEQQPVAGQISLREHAVAAARGEGEDALGLGLAGGEEGIPRGMLVGGSIFVIIQPRAAHVAVFHGKAQRLDQM